MRKGKLRVTEEGLAAYCPACKSHHIFDSRWEHNGDFDKPTFNPSIVVGAEDDPDKCHASLEDGIWIYWEDSKHEYAGMRVPLHIDMPLFHIIPQNDLREHDNTTSDGCWCAPITRQSPTETLIIHNSADGRELLAALQIQVAEIPNHLALVSRLWFAMIPTDDANVNIAYKWVEKRYNYLLPSFSDDAEHIAIMNYFQLFIRT